MVYGKPIGTNYRRHALCILLSIPEIIEVHTSAPLERHVQRYLEMRCASGGNTLAERLSIETGLEVHVVGEDETCKGVAHLLVCKGLAKASMLA